MDTPGNTRLIPAALQRASLQQLRGQPVFRESDLPQLLRELWADLTGEDQLAPGESERSELELELDAESLADDLREHPMEALTLNRDEATDEEATPEERVRATLRLVCALQMLSEDDWARPALQSALEGLEDTLSTDTPESELHLAAPAITALLHVSHEAPEVAWHWLSRLSIPVPSETRAPMGVLIPLGVPAGPGPDLALGLLGHHHSAARLRSQQTKVTDPGVQRMLALASWRTGTYDRSRHPHLSLNTLRRASYELLKQAAGNGADADAARAALGLHATRASHPLNEVPRDRQETRHSLLLTAAGTYLPWSHDLTLPRTNGFHPANKETQLQNLRIKFAALPVFSEGDEDDRNTHLAVMALLLCAAQPSFPLPEPFRRAEHLALPAYRIALSTPRVAQALAALQHLRGVSPADQALAARALELMAALSQSTHET